MLFTEDYIYGRILEFLHENPNREFGITELMEQFKASEKILFIQQLRNLDSDGMVVRKDTAIATKSPEGIYMGLGSTSTYRISHQGYGFILDIKKHKKSHKYVNYALLVSFGSLLISLYLLLSPYIFRH